MSGNVTPMVVQYLYLHSEEEAFYYPTARSTSSAARVAMRYLECALTQAATLRLRDVDCELALATNIEDRSALGHEGEALLARIEALGVRIIPTPYEHRPGDDGANYVSSRYLLDAILTAIDGQPPDRKLWFTDLDCVWPDAARAFAAAPQAPEIGCIFVPYPPDWVAGISKEGQTRNGVAALAGEMGAPEQPLPPWIGGELITGSPQPLRALVAACEQTDAKLAEMGKVLGAEEEILSLVGALGLVRYHDLSAVARRVSTGPRTGAPRTQDPLSLGLWHLPAEKGLSLRRAARQVLSGRDTRLRRDLAEPQRFARRFNVLDAGLRRQLRDDSWIASQRMRDIVVSALKRA